MDRRELDDALYAAMTEALGNSGIPIAARAKARIADELTAEAVRLVTVQMKVEGGAAAKADGKKPRKARKPRAKKGNAEAPARDDPTVPAPFGAHRQ